MTDVDFIVRRALRADADTVTTSDQALEIILARATAPTERKRWPAWRIAVPAACAAAAAAAVLVVTQLGGGGAAWAAELVAVAERAPRLLLEGPGWHVARADEFAADEGEMTFASGSREVDLHWYPAAELDSFLRDRAVESTGQATVTVLGHEARVFRIQSGDSGYYDAWWSDGSHAVNLRSDVDSEEEFRALLGALAAVDVDAWLSAMPESVVQPTNRAAVVDEMLQGIPQPPGFDRSALERSGLAKDRYQLGAAVAGAAVCGWIDEWIAAKAAGDSARVTAAVQAMATSHEWPILEEMAAQGGYPDEVWVYADAMAGDGTVIGGRVLTIEESYGSALGCDAL